MWIGSFDDYRQDLSDRAPLGRGDGVSDRPAVRVVEDVRGTARYRPCRKAARTRKNKSIAAKTNGPTSPMICHRLPQAWSAAEVQTPAD